MRKILLMTICLILLFNITAVFAHEHNFAETKQLIDSKISCDKLSEEQLEAIGDYLMEQMHSGEQHELMDNMMGGEGSESLKQVHINLARMMYCGGGGMMGSGGMIQSGGMMNMMGGNTVGQTPMQANTIQGKIAGNVIEEFSYNNNYIGFVNVFFVILLIGTTTLVCLLIIKLGNGFYGKRK